MDIKLIGMATVASLCDAVAEIMTGQPSYDEKAALLTEVECDNRAEIERFYGGARAAFKKDPGNGVSLFLLVSLDDIRAMPAKERVRSLDEILSLLEAALKNGYVTDQDAIDVVGKVDELLNTLLAALRQTGTRRRAAFCSVRSVHVYHYFNPVGTRGLGLAKTGNDVGNIIPRTIHCLKG